MSEPRLLVVDDEAGIRMTLSANFELEGFEVVEAESVAMALALLADQDFDLVLSDIRMPGLSGIDLLSRLRSDGREIPVVLMTAFAEESKIDEATRNGVFTILTKPFDIDHGAALLQRALKRPTVLIVDDAPNVASTTAAALSTMGLRVQDFNDGASALESLRNGVHDVCIVDLVMPDMDGLELSRRLREEDASIVIIVYSGCALGEQMMMTAAANGAFRCFRKPLDPFELAAAVAAARGSTK